jgi:hypothetical protein
VLFAFKKASRYAGGPLVPGTGPILEGARTFLLTGPYAPSEQARRIDKDLLSLLDTGATRATTRTAATERTELPAVSLPQGETFRPNELARLLFGSAGEEEGGKRIRDYLRAEYPRTPAAKNTAWILSREVAQDVIDHFVAQRNVG